MGSYIQFRLHASQHLHLLLSQVATICLFINELSAWMLALISLSFIWQLSQLLVHRNITKQLDIKTPKLVVVLFALTGAGIIVINGKSLGLLIAMVHLITFAYAIKPLEIKTRKDFYIIILIGLFLQACAFIFVQSIWFAIVVLV